LLSVNIAVIAEELTPSAGMLSGLALSVIDPVPGPPSSPPPPLDPHETSKAKTQVIRTKIEPYRKYSLLIASSFRLYLR
jgi:hypothetical protein